jgi:hypothetical protein
MADMTVKSSSYGPQTHIARQIYIAMFEDPRKWTPAFSADQRQRVKVRVKTGLVWL